VPPYLQLAVLDVSHVLSLKYMRHVSPVHTCLSTIGDVVGIHSSVKLEVDRHTDGVRLD